MDQPMYMVTRPNGFYCKKYFIGIFAFLGALFSLLFTIGTPFLILNSGKNQESYGMLLWILIPIGIIMFAINVLGTYGAFKESLRCMRAYYIINLISLVITIVLFIGLLVMTQSISGITNVIFSIGWCFIVDRYVKDLKTVENERQSMANAFKG